MIPEQNQEESADRMDGNAAGGREGREAGPVQPVLPDGTGAALLLPVGVCVGGGGDSLEGETWFSSLEITSTRRLLGRNIKIQPDISQVFYHALSDPIPSYHTLHTLKHGYPFLDTLLTFKCGEVGKGEATFHTRGLGRALLPRKTQTTGILGDN